jgi:tRNA modification GTPase
VVMAGAPNAGKSTLLNALCGSDVAIVTPIAGTTRDLLQHAISLDGIPVHLTDTAGLRDSSDTVEAEGIRRARAAINDADQVLLLVDMQQSQQITTDPLWHELKTTAAGKLTVVLNKTDLCKLEPAVDHVEGVTSIRLSAHTKAGLDLLRDHLKRCAGVNQAEDGGFIARRRHLIALDAANVSLQQALHCLEHLQASELVAEELRKAQQALDEITGKFTSDDLLGAIFSSFCIGK